MDASCARLLARSFTFALAMWADTVDVEISSFLAMAPLL
jgi:hypothetical protein